jgi:hypothetical protein
MTSMQRAPISVLKPARWVGIWSQRNTPSATALNQSRSFHWGALITRAKRAIISSSSLHIIMQRKKKAMFDKLIVAKLDNNFTAFNDITNSIIMFAGTPHCSEPWTKKVSPQLPKIIFKPLIQYYPTIFHVVSYCHVRFEIFTVVALKNGVFCDVNAVWLLCEPTFRGKLSPTSSEWQESVN